MEKAIFITKIAQLKFATNKYGRIYFGNEFCQRLIPPIQDLRKALEYARARNLDFSLVTPYVTDESLGKLNRLFDLADSSGYPCEAVVNDWGVLGLLRRDYKKLQPVLGRLLTKQKRDPRLVKLLKREGKVKIIPDLKDRGRRIIVIQKNLPQALDYYYKGANTASVPVIHRFLNSLGIKRIELDNVSQGLVIDLPKQRLTASIYLPFVYISTAFFCPTAGCAKGLSYLKIRPCSRECQKYVFRLRHKAMPKVIYLKGNTQFYRNDNRQMAAWEKMGIDRLVYEPDIPV